ncbi:DUF805 domain-containing protein [Jannaschia pohangensis]|uniref:Uncharacterized membrane protein YhaH, DUF805 family n=1 Tax=Jannaschia pohangensis TaxID=390807 RepID=A0A1I3I0G2_9RHOB|nr:DUF805 domain-containing protein [Jannaschia pohangensis]SFI41464.1 Uncharacterized membrane protein YhaH, DUF805 family [Jannaschia pohangensis]
MGPIDATVRCLINPFTWRGRARPSEYWWFFLTGFILSALVTSPIYWPAVVLGWNSARTGTTLTALEIEMMATQAVSVPVWWGITIASWWIWFSSLAVAIRRLHDTDRSGWWVWITLIPLVGFIILLVLLILPGDTTRNSFGPVWGGGGKAAPEPRRSSGYDSEFDPIGRPRSEVDRVQGAEALRALRQSRMPN